MYSASARALNRIVQDGRFTVPEMADVAGCSDKHLYNVRNGEAELRQSQVEKLSRWLCRHGETRLSECFVCAEYEVARREAASSDGRIDDEVNDLVRHAGSASEAHQARNGPVMDDAIARLEEVMTRIKAERDRLD